MSKLDWKEIGGYTRSIIFFILLLTLVYFGLFHHNTQHYDTTTKVNLFPVVREESFKLKDGEEVSYPVEGAKNYRVDANIEVKREWYGLWGVRHTSVWTNAIHWPNGGRSHFKHECLMEETNTVFCTDTEDREYKIEVVNNPNNL